MRVGESESKGSRVPTICPVRVRASALVNIFRLSLYLFFHVSFLLLACTEEFNFITARRRVRTRQQAQVLLPAQSATRPEKPVYRFDDNSPCGRKCKPLGDGGSSPPGHRDRTIANGTAEPKTKNYTLASSTSIPLQHVPLFPLSKLCHDFTPAGLFFCYACQYGVPFCCCDVSSQCTPCVSAHALSPHLRSRHGLTP